MIFILLKRLILSWFHFTSWLCMNKRTAENKAIQGEQLRISKGKGVAWHFQSEGDSLPHPVIFSILTSADPLPLWQLESILHWVLLPTHQPHTILSYFENGAPFNYCSVLFLSKHMLPLTFSTPLLCWTSERSLLTTNWTALYPEGPPTAFWSANERAFLSVPILLVFLKCQKVITNSF